MKELTLQGSYYKIGTCLGKKFNSYRSSYYVENVSKEQLDFTLECESITKKYFPEILEEIQGIADSSNIDYNNLIVSELSIGLDIGCTVFAIPANYTKNNKLLFARSMDWFNETIHYSFITHTKPDRKLASLGFSETPVGRLGGINEAGLIIGSSNCVWRDFLPGMIDRIIIRWILDNCKNVKETVNFLEKVPHMIGDNFLIVDKSEPIVRVEAFRDMVISTYFEDEFVATANHYFSPEFDVINPIKPKHSIDRIDYLNNWIRNLTTPLDIYSIKEIQSVHEVELCPHVQEYFNGELMNLTTS